MNNNQIKSKCFSSFCPDSGTKIEKIEGFFKFFLIFLKKVNQ